MSQINSYYLYKKYEKRGNQPWLPVFPNVWSVDGDGTKPLVIKESADPSCMDYFSFTALEDGTFKFNGSSSADSLSYSIDDGVNWHTLPYNTDTPTISSGQTIMFKGSDLTILTNNGIGTFTSSGRFNVQGNIMSLIYGDNFNAQTSLDGKDYVFYGLFYECTKLVSAENLKLPTEMSDCCYTYLFCGCTSLTTAPQLLATTLTDYCYCAMFSGCTSLTTVQQTLSATTMANYSCAYMFRGCTSLTTAPQLLATTLSDYCCAYMFQDCTNLTTAPSLPATTLANNCYRQMFRGCSSLTTVPTLSATTLVDNCYYGMFYSCSTLTAISCLATDISANNCTYAWLSNVGANGTFTKAANMSSWTTGGSGIPSTWTVQDYTS